MEAMMGMDKSIRHVGLDVHQESIDVAVANGSVGAERGWSEVRHVGQIGGDLAALDKTLRRLMSAGHRLHVVYEAGPCGFVICRHLRLQGLDCEVVAPSTIPRKPGDRVKTDRRDAMMLARLARADELGSVRVPDEVDEAMRDLVRAREDAVREQRNARHRLKALLLRHGVRYAGKTARTPAHLRWLATVKLAQPTQQLAFQEYVHAISESTARISRLEGAMREQVEPWALRPLVQALQALRGVQLIAAITLVAELQDFLRFEHPRKLMAYVGLAPSEHTSGQRRRQGSITKAGNSAARRMLAEVAWHYLNDPRVTSIIAKRHDQLPQAITNIAWSAQVRLTAKFQRLLARKVMKTKAVVAVARELTGFVWAIGQHVQRTGWSGVKREPTC